MTSEATLSHRYRELGDQFDWRVFRLNVTCYPPAQVHRGRLSERPEWLCAVVDAAKLGGHAMVTNTEVPMYVMWFDTDAENNFIRFHDHA